MKSSNQGLHYALNSIKVQFGEIWLHQRLKIDFFKPEEEACEASEERFLKTR